MFALDTKVGFECVRAIVQASVYDLRCVEMLREPPGTSAIAGEEGSPRNSCCWFRFQLWHVSQ
jgi:hypothetical protein